MKRFRLHTAASVVLAAALALTGCSGGGGNEAKPSSDPGNNSGGNQAGGGQQVTLSMHSWRVEDTEGYAKLIAAFEAENPNIKIDFKPFKATEYNTILNTALQSDSGPDILQLRPYATGAALATAGYLEPLDNLPGISNIPKEVLAGATGKDGKVYGVPLTLSTTQFFYNKKIFDDNGVSIPKSWDELIAASKALKEKGIIPISFGAKEGWLLSLSHGVIAPASFTNGYMDKLLKGESDLKSPEFLKSIQRMQELIPYFPENFVGLELNDMRTLFATGKAAMFINGSFEMEGIKKLNPDLQLDFFPMPTDDGKQVITTWVDGSYAVNAKSKHKAEALKFMEFMTTKKFGELYANQFKMISPIPGVSAEDPLVNRLTELTQTNATPYLMIVHFSEGNPTTKKTLENALQGMYLNKLTPEQVVDEVQKSAATWFEPFKK
ncbi:MULTISPECIES: ABC transporter substrate-binding protein [Brevibacillus]|jgi:raffinose/stachyose/melibiose transport system substrate-binding protein|uniref:ABC transporter substrate-binding protein n=1 Tax=Brevibacillus TaxID=55080 RepID=UPI000F0A4711|nr:MULTISPECIES: extracellular solute-binding protein [Brevibacillus]MDR7314806.1 raffinose/stachyose/melibiose transport system substrate-binding protein [Brevibacillus nitrificans]MEC2131462.1 extracellular solute-binding protein [Brevibacillus centrosporus]MED4906995.1 extracellular solute-binding protein [Brevibacillus centrosporus]RNB72511.1 extracellular solute-binding protein [Brevibacillus centrosporus]GED31102.1 sugar ABC transporter substrate-binding protein [Brevibacillus centrospor